MDGHADHIGPLAGGMAVGASADAVFPRHRGQVGRRRASMFGRHAAEIRAQAGDIGPQVVHPIVEAVLEGGVAGANRSTLENAGLASDDDLRIMRRLRQAADSRSAGTPPQFGLRS